MTEELKPIDVSKYTVTENGNVIRTDNTETLENALARIEELEKENARLKLLIETEHIGNSEFWKSVWACKKQVDDLNVENAKLKEKLDFISKNAETAGKMLVDMVKSEVEKAEQGKENN